MGKVLGKVLDVALVVAAVAVNVIPGLGQVASAGIIGSLTVGGALIGAGIGAGLGLIGSLLQKNPTTSPSQADRLNVSLTVDAPRKIQLGITAMSTDLRYHVWNGPKQDLIDQVIVVASHKVNSIDQIYLEDKLAWTASGGTQGTFAGFFWCDTYLENSHTSAPTIEGGRWTPTTAGMVGCASVQFRFQTSGKNSPFASGVSNRVTIVGKGASFYDPRHDTSVGGSGSHRAADQSTWQFTAGATELGRNNALSLLFYLLGWRIQNPSTSVWKLAVGLGLPVDRIDLDSFITGANLCDEAVTKADGTTEPRYRCDGIFSEADDPKTVIDSICASMNAVLRDVGGKLSLQVLHNDLATPVLDFDDDDVLADFTWNAGNALNDAKNIAKGQYTDPSTNSLYQMVDYPPVGLASLDGIDRTDTVDYALVQSPGQVQRLAKQRIQRAQYAGAFAADFNAKGWGVRDGDIVRLTFSALGFNQKLFRVAKATIQVTGVSPLILIEENVAIYAWDAEESPAIQAAVPNTFDPLLLPIPSAIGVAATTAEWPNVADTDPAHPRPADGATVGAPAGTNVASMEAAAVVAEIAAHTVSIDSITSAIEPIPSIQSDVDALQAASDTLVTEVNTISVTTIPTLTNSVSAIQLTSLPSLTTQLAGLTAISVDEQAARRQLIRDTDSLAQSLLRALSEAQHARQVMSDAGIYIDPASGKARIYAVDQNATTISQVQIALNAVNATIALKASVDFVNAQIAAAVLDPSQVADLTDIYARLTSAEVDISGLDATVALKADAITLTGLSGTVTTLSSQLDALSGTVTTKADSTTVTALGTTLSSVQATLAAYGDVSSYGVTIRQALTAAEVANDAGLRALLAGDAASQAAFTQSAQINSELTTKIVAGLSSEATSRLALAAQMAANQATALNQISTLVTTTTATATSLDALSATVAGQAAEIDTLNTITLGGNTTIAGMSTDIRQARYASDLAADSALRALVAGDVGGQNLAAQLASVQFQLTTTIVTGFSSESSARLALTARVATNEAAIVTTNTALATLDAATTTQLAAAESQIANANARIDTEQTTRAAADTANATSISALSSQVNDATTGLPATRAGLITEQSTRATADTANATSISNLSATVNDATSGLAATRASLATEVSARANADTALSTSITNLTAQVNSSSTGLPAALAAVATEATARATADTALSTSISTLSAQVNDSSTGLPATRASIASEATTRANADSALSTSISGLSATVNDGTTGLAATRSQLATEQTTRSTADTTNATAISTLSSQVNNATTGLPATVAALSTEATTRASADTANATAITSLASEVHDSSTGLAATRAALATETSTRSTADTANASSISTLSGQVNNATTGVPATAANLATEITARASGDTANSTAISTLSAQVTNNTNGLVATNANLATEVTTRVSGDSANAANISSLSAQVNDATTGLPATRAAVASEATARAGADSANASAISALSGTVGANTASISNLEEVVIDPTGTTARAVMQVDANGNLAGLVLSASNTAVSHIGLVAGSTVIAGTDGSVLATFEQDGDVAYIPNLQVDTLKVGTGGSVGLPVTAGTSGSHTGSTSDVVVLSTTLHMAAAGSAIVMLGAQQSYSGSGSYNIYVRTDGTSAHDTCQSANGAGAVTPNPGNTGAIIGLAAGDHTIAVHWAAGSAVTLIYANLTIIPIYGS